MSIHSGRGQILRGCQILIR